MIRKILFWAHLSCGVGTGLIIFWLSLTGVLLTYEQQLLSWNMTQTHEHNNTQKLSYALLLDKAKSESAPTQLTNIVIYKDTKKPIKFMAGRAGSVHLNPYTSDVANPTYPKINSFFYTMTGLHRWLNLSRDNRDIGKTITGISNLVFLFIIVSGAYLWLPRIWRRAMFRARLIFIKAPNSKARDYNWHHVLGIWSLIPLFFIVTTAVVFSFSWANNLVFSVYGEKPPNRRGNTLSYNQPINIPANATVLPWETLIKQVQHTVPEWHIINLSIPKNNAETLQLTVNKGNGRQPHLRETLLLNQYTGEVLITERFSDKSAGIQTRSIIRFLHTGEVFGWLGQTIAGLASLASLFLVWTGLALAYRRLLQPILKRKKST